MAEKIFSRLLLYFGLKAKRNALKYVLVRSRVIEKDDLTLKDST